MKNDNAFKVGEGVKIKTPIDDKIGAFVKNIIRQNDYEGYIDKIHDKKNNIKREITYKVCFTSKGMKFYSWFFESELKPLPEKTLEWRPSILFPEDSIGR